MLETILSKIAAENLIAPEVNAGDVLGGGLNIALWGIGILAVVIILYSALQMITSRGDVEKAKKGRLGITWGMIGLAIAVSAGVISSVVINTVGK
jgi:hypothetical protein